MLKAKFAKTAILGISKENVKRLKDGQPILLNLSDIGLPDQEIMIMYGETEKSIAKQLNDEFSIAQRKKH